MADPHEPRKISKYSLWDIGDFLFDLRAKAQFTPGIDPQDRILSLQKIDFLFLESEKPNRQRDRARIIASWRELRSLLDKYQLFEDYQGEATLRFRVRLFIFGKSL